MKEWRALSISEVKASFAASFIPFDLFVPIPGQQLPCKDVTKDNTTIEACDSLPFSQ